ncbi:MAG: hypothetical protein V4805_00685 [Pseudomonadota bacterium]
MPTIADQAGKHGVELGSLPDVLNSPTGIAINASGALYSTSENAVTKIVLPQLSFTTRPSFVNLDKFRPLRQSSTNRSLLRSKLNNNTPHPVFLKPQ